MSFIRIRLTFQRPLPLKEVKNCWFLVDTSTCNTIADLEYLIKKRFIALSKSCTTVDLFLEDYLLPSQEKIEIIQNNDNVRSVFSWAFLTFLSSATQSFAQMFFIWIRRLT